ncbi:MAG: YidB family protein [Pseudomonadota bacterium]
MNVEELLRIGAEAFLSSLSKQEGANTASSDLSISKVMQALLQLFPRQGQNIDLGALIGKMQGGGLAAIAESWLGNGGNQSIDINQIIDLFGNEKIRGFAEQLGLSESDAIAGLQDAVPYVVDKASIDGTLGGVSGILGMAGKLFGRS